uniref:Uncharacterized protein n=1 Tax=Nonomuraea gerenzanensis TaxID=93944 RepID=A0A1M4E9Z5_9ACTN|nr:hypothetical protein BN4615_P5201 [Nonomuraea gerenzanensis]
MVGLETGDDAAVLRARDGTVIISTADTSSPASPGSPP